MCDEPDSIESGFFLPKFSLVDSSFLEDFLIVCLVAYMCYSSFVLLFIFNMKKIFFVVFFKVFNHVLHKSVIH